MYMLVCMSCMCSTRRCTRYSGPLHIGDMVIKIEKNSLSSFSFLVTLYSMAHGTAVCTTNTSVACSMSVHNCHHPPRFALTVLRVHIYLEPHSTNSYSHVTHNLTLSTLNTQRSFLKCSQMMHVLAGRFVSHFSSTVFS